MPYFYQSKYKRLNKFTLKWVEYQQKYTIVQRIIKKVRPHYYENLEGNNLANEQSVLIDLDDLKFVEKQDFEKLEFKNYLEDPELLEKMIKQLYYLDDYRWLLYWNNVGDKFFDQETVYDPKMLFDRKYSENYELEGTQSLVSRKFLNNFSMCFTIIGLKDMKTPLKHYLKRLNSIGVVAAEFLFCGYKLLNEYNPKRFYDMATPYFTNCFLSLTKYPPTGNEHESAKSSKVTNFIPAKSNIKSIKRARKYLIECANVHGVHVSLIPRGELFAYSLFDKETKTKLNWEQVKSIYENSILSISEKFTNPALKKEMDITQYLFEPILDKARKTYLSEKSENGFLKSLNQFQLDPEVKENKERLEYILKLVDDDCFQRLCNRSKSLPQMVKSLDFETKTKFQKFHLHTTLQIKKFKLESFKLYSWEIDFLNSSLTFTPSKKESIIVDPPKNQSSTQKKKKYTKIVVEDKEFQ